MISVYLDNCCYNRPYDNQNQPKIHLETEAKLYIQRLITEKKLNLVYSFVSEYENFNNPHDLRRASIGDFFKNASAFVDSSRLEEVTALAAEIMATGIKKMDALHVASSIIGNADYFLTTDKRLLRYSTPKIHIINPLDFVRDLEV